MLQSGVAYTKLKVGPGYMYVDPLPFLSLSLTPFLSLPFPCSFPSPYTLPFPTFRLEVGPLKSS